MNYSFVPLLNQNYRWCLLFLFLRIVVSYCLNNVLIYPLIANLTIVEEQFHFRHLTFMALLLYCIWCLNSNTKAQMRTGTISIVLQIYLVESIQSPLRGSVQQFFWDQEGGKEGYLGFSCISFLFWSCESVISVKAAFIIICQMFNVVKNKIKKI